MAMDTKPPETSTNPPAKHRDEGIKIFSWPKMIYIFPSMFIALICSVGMFAIREKSYDPSKPGQAVVTTDPSGEVVTTTQPGLTRLERFRTTQNLLGVLFLAVLAFNLLVMALDFPRFELLGWILFVLFVVFFVLWLGAYFELDLVRPIRALFESIYVFANAGFYLAYAITIFFLMVIVYVTRWLDYWEVLPNEILHHHGPLSDLERFSTMNLKFDKEIPDVLEYALLGAGRLVLHVPNMERAVVMDNVLFINTKEEALKRLMSRLEVRVTSDKEVDDATG
ncbi:hypothetical protein OJF2_30740 [Aquisphaera giovannonii]|uniref:Uncharacterized protein n=1 Tax=Aquisphaera giovannonii TaxID=406548 RepID=A0A5B9W2M6_9BACT|nr:hypothetical protein [Aquisphaera giovannonii]QEH34534.1 hypothetical protein OJF2_30740 [Aquisphaera giovannonii]